MEKRSGSLNKLLRAIDSVGGGSLIAAAVVLIFIISIDIMGAGFAGLIRSVFDTSSETMVHALTPDLMIVLLGLLFFIIPFALIRRRIASQVHRQRPTVRTTESRPCKAVVFFLSGNKDLRSTEDMRAALSGYSHPDSWRDVSVRVKNESLHRPLRMILEALDINATRRLEKVILLGSTGPSGTRCFVGPMQEFLTARLRDAGFETVEVIPPEAITGMRDFCDLQAGVSYESLQEGVRVEDIAACRAVFELISTALTQPRSKGGLGYVDQDILIDATGGTALVSIAAATFGILSPQRRFQYVSPDYRVTTQNVLYDWQDAD